MVGVPLGNPHSGHGILDSYCKDCGIGIHFYLLLVARRVAYG